MLKFVIRNCAFSGRYKRTESAPKQVCEINVLFLITITCSLFLFKNRGQDKVDNMNVKRMLHKMGYKKEDAAELKIEDLIKLGEMGYTKDEIEAIRIEEKEIEKTQPLSDQISALENQIAEMKKGIEVSAVRETVDEKADPEDLIQSGLNLLAGGSVNG